MKRKQTLPDGMTESDVQKIIKYYDNQTEGEAIDEAEAVFGKDSTTIIEIPRRLLPKVRELISRELKTKKLKVA